MTLALIGAASLLLPVATLRIASPRAFAHQGDQDSTSVRIGEMTFYNGALPLARRLTQVKQNMTMTPKEYRAIAATSFAPGSERFPTGVVAEGLYVSGVQPDGSVASWDRTGKLLAHGPNWKDSGLNAGELRFHISRLKLPGTDEWLDKATFDRLANTRAIETEFGVVGEPSGYFGRPRGSIYGNGYANFGEAHVWKPRRAQAKVNLYLTSSYGPWQTLVPDDGITLSPLVTRRGGVEAEIVASVPARFLARDTNGRPLWRLRLEPVDTRGNAVGNPRIAQYNESPAGSRVARLRFRFLTSELPFAKVTSVRLLARPVQTIYYRNVPTRPMGLPKAPVANP